MRCDLIVALGGDAGYRVAKAYDLYRKGYGTRILLTGAEGSLEVAREPYLGWRARYLIQKGVPRHAILLDSKSANSLEEASNTLDLMRREGWASVLVVSDPPHLRRLSLLWDSRFRNEGKSFVLIASEPEWWNAGRWWSHDHAAAFVLAEVIKLIYYYVLSP